VIDKELVDREVKMPTADDVLEPPEIEEYSEDKPEEGVT